MSYLHHPGIGLLLLLRGFVPCRDLRGPGGELSVFREQTHLLLLVKSYLSLLIPPMVEGAFEFFDPLFRHVVRSVGRAYRGKGMEWTEREEVH